MIGRSPPPVTTIAAHRAVCEQRPRALNARRQPTRQLTARSSTRVLPNCEQSAMHMQAAGAVGAMAAS
jgi:hypothetical protein